MKKLKTNIKIIVALIIGVILSTFFSCCFAETLINSEDVVYEDNSNLTANNVQDAIDGTCSKIDTRLSDIEDKLYTVKDMRHNSVSFNTSTSSIYTGESITFPAESYCSIVVVSVHSTGGPKEVFLSTSKSELLQISSSYNGFRTSGDSTIYMSFNEYVSSETTYYVWASHQQLGIGRIEVKGFCATKYK